MSGLVKVFTTLGVDYEIIFVNDASPDDAQDRFSPSSATAIPRHRRHPQRGTSARRARSRAACASPPGDAVVLLDGDLQDPPELIADFVRASGWRATTSSTGCVIKRETDAVLQIAYKLFYRSSARSSYVRVPLDAGDFSLIDRRWSTR